jgi:hypothetical protein
VIPDRDNWRVFVKTVFNQIQEFIVNNKHEIQQIELSSSNGEEFLILLSNYQFLKQVSAPWSLFSFQSKYFIQSYLLLNLCVSHFTAIAISPCYKQPYKLRLFIVYINLTINMFEVKLCMGLHSAISRLYKILYSLKDATEGEGTNSSCVLRSGTWTLFFSVSPFTHLFNRILILFSNLDEIVK